MKISQIQTKICQIQIIKWSSSNKKNLNLNQSKIGACLMMLVAQIEIRLKIFKIATHTCK